jgi:hypothetical protein
MEPWEGPFSGCLPLCSPVENRKDAVAFPVLLVPGEILVRGILGKGEYKKGLVVVDAYIGYAEIFWDTPFSPVPEELPEKCYPSRFSYSRLLAMAEEAVRQSATQGVLGRFRGILSYLQTDKIQGCWRVYVRERGIFRDCFTGRERPELEFVQHLWESQER